MARGHDLASGSFAAASGPSPAAKKAAELAAAALPDAGAIAAGGGIDPLSDVLRVVRLTGALFFRVEAGSPWVAAVPPARAIRDVVLRGAQHVVSYHVVTRGGCWAGLDGEAATRLEAGDVLVVPHGDAYLLATAPGRHEDPPLDLAVAFFRSLAGQRLLETVREGGGGPDEVEIVCGFLGCDLLPFNPVLATLPRLVHLRAPAGRDRLRQLIEFALAESRENRAGRDCVLLRISELMFVEMVRRYLAALPEEERGWLAALRDDVVGRALALLHERPAQPWTIETLARETGVSRSALAERFTRLVGQPPMQYLSRWRVQRAAGLLADGMAKVSAVAFDVGYDSEAAFSRAFKKAVGLPPATWRDQRRGAQGA